MTQEEFWVLVAVIAVVALVFTSGAYWKHRKKNK